MKNVIPDIVSRTANSINDVKSVVSRYDARGQLSAMGELAQRAGMKVNIFVDASRFSGQISQTVKNAVDLSQGAIYSVDQATNAIRQIYP